MPKYALHGGFVISRNDGDEHFVSAVKLIDLYELRPDEYCLWSTNNYGRVWEDYVHLYPRVDGNYGRPD
jgi:hypothetical protein